ncbi:MAG: 50S ribosomal protein L23 [Patescibacteria group bacterium]
MIITPRISEKAYKQSTEMNVYVFDVPKDANKLDIKQAVESSYSVTVTKVRTLVQDGKKARSIRLKQRGSYVVGTRPDVKKAYVTLKEGDEITVFEQVDGGNE